MPTTRRQASKIEAFDFQAGRVLARKYEVLEQLGLGWEGEVYLLRELTTGIERAGKFFYPHRNPNNRTIKFHAKKLHRLRHCPIVMQYHTQEVIQFKQLKIPFLVSEYIEGEKLTDFLNRQRGKRLSRFEALHLLYALAVGMEHIHSIDEYHGDLHPGNIIIRPYGIGYDLKLFDMFHWKATKAENIRDDVLEMIRLFHRVLGGKKHYPAHPREIKDIICGLKHSLIFKKFRTAGQLKEYLETIEWS